MRLIGHLPTEDQARTFSDVLYVRGIQNQVEAEAGHGWAVWVGDDDELRQASEVLAAFRANPHDAKFKADARQAARVRREQAEAEGAYAKKVRDSRQIFHSLTGSGFGPLTVALICVSVGVFIFSKYGQQVGRVAVLFLSEYNTGLPEVMSGQVWRLLTPIFIHFGVLHIFFNLLWLRDLGNMIEQRQGTLHLALLVAVIGILSNLAQYGIHLAPLFTGGPFFGGMSGVVYGLVGYIWMRGKYDPACGLALHPATVLMMVIWFFVCLAGLFGSVANMAHFAGLVMGLAWGYLASRPFR